VGLRAFLRAEQALDIDACVRCGLCADACHYYRADPDPHGTPAFKVKLLHDAMHARDEQVRPDLVETWIDEIFGRCTMCGRCMLHCSVGLNVPAIVRAGRSALVEAHLVPEDLQATVETTISSGNSMGVSRDDWIETVRWLDDELQAETGDPTAHLPLDEPDADYLYVVNPREPKFFPLSLVAAGAIFHAAKAKWTLPSDWFDVTNYGLFSGDDENATLFARRLRDARLRLNARTLVLGECGHGFNANRWRAPEWLAENGTPVPVISVLELVSAWINEGRLRLDPARNTLLTTLHDPCNLVRMGGVIEESRELLSASVAHWVEMTPNREQNFCCGGGGGQLAMTRFAKRRLGAGRTKAGQIKATGAKIVAAPCHNCVDQLRDLNKEYKLGVDVKTVCELVAGALVWTA
jgi:Fe-S oxidoreductase